MKIIDNTAELEEICRNFSLDPYVCVDTEFTRSNTYKPLLCLIQLGNKKRSNFIVDPLSKSINLEPLFLLLNKSPVIKVFHSCRQDIEIIFNYTGEIPRPIFDTQLASMLCGLGEDISYEKLVFSKFNIKINKSIRYSDWSIRPLSKEHLIYAEKDVEYLSGIYEMLTTDLKNKNRMDWLVEETKKIYSPAVYKNDPKEAWRKVKLKKNDMLKIDFIRILAEERELIAQKINIPRKHVFSDSFLSKLSKELPLNKKNFDKIKHLNDEDKLRIIEDIKNIQINLKNNFVVHPEKKILNLKNTQKNEKYNLLLALLTYCSNYYNIPSKIIAKTTDLKLISNGELDVDIFKGWKKEVYGNYVKKLINGEISITIKNNNIEIIDHL